MPSIKLALWVTAGDDGVFGDLALRVVHRSFFCLHCSFKHRVLVISEPHCFASGRFWVEKPVIFVMVVEFNGIHRGKITQYAFSRIVLKACKGVELFIQNKFLEARASNCFLGGTRHPYQQYVR